MEMLATEKLENFPPDAEFSSSRVDLGQTPTQISSKPNSFNPGREIVFVDAGVPDYLRLVAGVKPGVEVAMIDCGGDGVEQITLTLEGGNFNSVHIVSHGAPGCLYLGNTQLSLDTFERYASQLQTWKAASVLLYGCSVAAGDAGAEFIAKLHQLTGAKIAASKTPTGNSALGGNWELEVVIGEEQPFHAFPPSVMAAYEGILANASLNFSPGTAYSVGIDPISVVVEDFDGDGKQDLATANFSSKNVSVMLGNGNGTFKTATNYGVGTATGTYDITTGDFNGDRRKDLAVANRDSNQVSILLGNGDGTFGSATNYSVSQPFSVKVSDFNKDGYQDLAVGTGTYGISILLGKGDGTFGTATSVLVGEYSPLQMTVGDFNGDGNKDIATANYWGTNNQGNISILLGNGNGTFGSPTTYVAGTQGSSISNSPRPRDIVVGDFNQDGKEDLAVANQGSRQISILLGKGDGTFGTATNYANVSGDKLTIGDFDGDGIQDLATNSLNVLLGNGDGTFDAPITFPTSRSNSIASGDFDGDGSLDLVSTRYSNDVFVLLQNGVPTDLILDNNTVGENSPTNTEVGTFTTTDPDTGNTFTYKLVNGQGDTDNSAFTIAGNKLLTNASFDYETKSNYSIRVRTTDSANASIEKTLAIAVSDVSEFNIISGTSAQDKLQGTAGNDQYNGGLGDDEIYSSEGADILSGGEGIDSAVYSASSAAVQVDLTTGTGSGGHAQGDKLISIETVYGSSFGDGIIGDDGDNTFYGGNGNDTLTGKGGQDYLSGQDGNDVISGGDDNDRLLGGNGDDTLIGGSGNDIVSGGNGIDILTGADNTTKGLGEIDRLKGDAGNDIFVLGTSTHAYYNDGVNNSNGKSDYALIEDFTINQDVIQLYGGASYYLGATPKGVNSGTGIFIDNDGVNGLSNNDELIGVLSKTNLSNGIITNSTAGFSFVYSD